MAAARREILCCELVRRINKIYFSCSQSVFIFLGIFYFLYFFIFRSSTNLGPYDDPINCRGCQAENRYLFWEERRHRVKRLDAFLDSMDNGPLSFSGDKVGEDFIPHVATTPFDEGRWKNKDKVFPMIESGMGKQHTCLLGRIPQHLDVPMFLGAGTKRVKRGTKGFYVKLQATIVGMVEQNPRGRWEHIVAKRFALHIPTVFQEVLGREFRVDGYFRLTGEKASRRKKIKVEFMERYEGTLFLNVPRDTHVDLVWDEMLLPAPTSGLLWKEVGLSVIDWKPEN